MDPKQHNALVKRLVKKVSENTAGTEGDPLTQSDIEKVVRATLAECRRNAIYKPLTKVGD